MAKKVNLEIISRAKNAKHYSIIADCTLGISKEEQFSLTIRFADIYESLNIQDHFIEIFPLKDASGAGILRYF